MVVHAVVVEHAADKAKMYPCDLKVSQGFLFTSQLIYMSIKISILSASKGVRPYATQLRTIADSAAASVKKLLPIKDVDIVFYENPGATIDELGGIGGFTPNAHTIFVSLDPRHPNFAHALQYELFFMLVHEFHHTIRWQKGVKDDTLLEALIFEGLADHFAMEVTGRKKPSLYSNALTSAQKRTFLKKASKEWNKPTYNHQVWFYGATPKVIPRWAGYTLGYDLVVAYLQTHPGETASALASADASLFI